MLLLEVELPLHYLVDTLDLFARRIIAVLLVQHFLITS